MITTDLMQKFLEFLTKATDFDIRVVDDDNLINQLVDFFIDISIDEELDVDILEWLFSFERIIWCTAWLKRKEYNQIISKWYDRKYIKDSQFISNVVTTDGTQMVILEFIRVNQKGSHKTVEELQNELDSALSIEDYTSAAKLQKRIKAKLKRKVKKHAPNSK